uniref:Uncharacterized protein n=1 Tax=Neogobius melanostomus TaxID=47308 RepID=A0A8C6UR36_9GOBI
INDLCADALLSFRFCFCHDFLILCSPSGRVRQTVVVLGEKEAVYSGIMVIYPQSSQNPCQAAWRWTKMLPYICPLSALNQVVSEYIVLYIAELETNTDSNCCYGDLTLFPILSSQEPVPILHSYVGLAWLFYIYPQQALFLG